MDATVTVGPQGRLVIPAPIRAALGLRPGDRLHVSVDQSRLIFERPEDAVSELRRLDSRTRHRSLVAELLAERRAEAATE